MSPFMKLALAGALAALAPVAALAHHGWSSYIEAEPVTLTGPLHDVAWTSPHATAKMNWREREWDVILAPITRLEARGLTQAEINAGQSITLTGYVRRDGTAEMRIERIMIGSKTVELR